MNKIVRNNIFTLLLLTVFCMSSCDDYIDIKPKGQVIPTRTQEFRDMLTQAYNRFPISRGLVSIASDEMDIKPNDPDALYKYRNIYQWDQNAGGTESDLRWLTMYKVIFYCNYILENIDDSIEGTEEELAQIKGETYLLRAYSYFVLTNIFGDQYQEGVNNDSKTVPIVTEVDMSATPFPSTLKVVNDSIVSDIAKGKKLISTVKQEENILKYRFSQHAITAFQARLSLYHGKWNDAFTYAKDLIENGSYSLVDFSALDEDSVLPTHFESSEAILSLENTCEYKIQNSVVVSKNLQAAFDQDNDLRFSKYLKYNYDVGDYFFSPDKISYDKFKSSFRLSEMYLIAAEAAYELKNYDTAKTYIKALIEKRYKSDAIENEKLSIDDLSNSDLKVRIFNERFKELCAEGHRWFDLKRMGKPSITHVVKESEDVSKEYVLNEGDVRYVFPFPNEAVENNPNLNY